MLYLTVFVVTLFVILFGSVAVAQLHRRRRDAPPAFPPPDPRLAVYDAQPAPEGRKLMRRDELPKVLAADHLEGRHDPAVGVIGCELCEGRAGEATAAELALRRAQATGREPDRPPRKELHVTRGGDITLRVDH